MRNYMIRRIIQLIPVFIVIVVAIFILTRLVPGGPLSTMMDPSMTPETRALLEERFGLNKSIPEQFVNWASELLKGNLGYSTKYSRTVVGVIGDFIFNTFILQLFALIIALSIGIPAGIISATKQYSVADNALTVFSLLGISMPSFFFGLLLLKFFAIDNQILPLFGMMDASVRRASPIVQALNIFQHMILPGLVLGLSSMASFMRYTRSSMLEVIRQDYVRTARAKGLAEKVVIYRHALRNAMIPIITLLGYWIPGLLAGSFITETIFGWPGLGKVAVDAVMSRDYGLLMANAMMNSFLMLVGLLLADFFYGVADPRVKYD